MLNYGRVVGGIMLTALSIMASKQVLPTENTVLKTHKFMDYAAPHPVVILTHPKSDMILVVYSDPSYISEPQACSHTGKHRFLASDVPIPANNAALLNNAQINRSVMPIAAKAEMGATFHNKREATPPAGI